MGRVKEQLLIMEYKQMNKEPNNNLRDYLLTMECEFIPETYEQDNYYLIKYIILDLISLEPVTIKETILKTNLDSTVPKQLIKMLQTDNPSVNSALTYKALINNGWVDGEFLFEAIPLKDDITQLKDLLIIPSSEKLITHYLYNIQEHLDSIAYILTEELGANNEKLHEINKELDLMNELAQ